MIVLALALLLVLVGCERRPLEDRDTDMAEVSVEVDWSRSTLTPAEATVMFYNENGNSPRTLYLIGNRGTIKLPVGNYSVIAFNDKMGDFSQFAFRKTAYYKTIEVYATEMSEPSRYYGEFTDQFTEEEYDVLASDSRDRFEVTQEMLDQTRANRAMGRSAATHEEVHLVMRPINVVVGTKLTVHVKNMHLIRAGAHRVKLTGFAESTTLWNRKASAVCMTHTLPLSYSAYYEGSEKDGFMREQFATFGLCVPEVRAPSILFLFEAILRDKEQTKFSYQKDITNLVEIDAENGLKITMEVGSDVGNSNPPISIPLIDPIEDGAFRPGVDGWEEEEVVVPL